MNNNQTCIEPNCTKAVYVKKRSMCKYHSEKWLIANSPVVKICTIEDCTNRVHAKGLCHNHYVCNRRVLRGPRRPRGKVAGYRAAHRRVEAARGKAASHTCLGCDGPAAEWSLNPGAVDLLYGITGRHSIMAPYSLDVDSYDALCVRCHHERDAA